MPSLRSRRRRHRGTARRDIELARRRGCTTWLPGAPPQQEGRRAAWSSAAARIELPEAPMPPSSSSSCHVPAQLHATSRVSPSYPQTPPCKTPSPP
uniref:Uncharacterized protein n=1 Tax=Triticum urartu TaxID=4572 RepID=A0A8R7JYW7_TRIUA